jgi:hypothetical protein
MVCNLDKLFSRNFAVDLRCACQGYDLWYTKGMPSMGPKNSVYVGLEVNIKCKTSRQKVRPTLGKSAYRNAK